MSSEEPQATHACPICGKTLTRRSLNEHKQNSHLGTKCYFPNSNFTQDAENDPAMTDELLRANSALGTVAEDKKYWCYWPGCQNGAPRHSYDSAESLRRHLRTKQRDMFKQNEPNAAHRYNRIPSGVLEAWTGVKTTQSARDAVLTCASLLLDPNGNIVQVAPPIWHQVCNYLLNAHDALVCAIEHVKSLTNIPETRDSWGYLSQQQMRARHDLVGWATSPAHLSLESIHNTNVHISYLINELERHTTSIPNPQFDAANPQPDVPETGFRTYPEQ
ncbi:hypothetical protein F5Y05DRAFT_9859 [Hypoxylon sp. FL0543]|nr:hypothetical protein F5Y05DRAFT_9859 [Hypoxylon sp. FL0543]